MGTLNELEEAATLSIVVPLPKNTPVSALLPIVTSIRLQESPHWQLVVAAESAENIGTWLGSQLDSTRASVVNLNKNASLADAVNAALAKCLGIAVAIVAPDDALAPAAVGTVLNAFNRTTEIVYTDEVTASNPVVKPVFSPERLRGQNYIGNLVAYRRTLLSDIGGVRSNLPGAELYDLILRATNAAANVERLEKILFARGAQSLERAWSKNDITTLASIRTALMDHLDGTGGGVVNSVSVDGIYDTRRTVHGDPLVSIVIPTRGDSATIRGEKRCLVVEAVRGVIEKSTYKNVEFVIVLDELSPEYVRDDLKNLARDQVRFIDWTGPFSFSGKMNLGVLHSNGQYLLLLNDDVEVISPGWIEAMLALAQRPGAGLVGAMLYFEDETIQHAGHAYYRSDVTHIGLNSERGAVGPESAFLTEREVDGVTAACAIIPRNVFLEAGGFSELLPGNFNDVDLCMKVAALGYQSYWTPHAELYHFESKSRDPRVAHYEIETTWGRWEHLFWESKYWPTDPHTLYRNVAD